MTVVRLHGGPQAGLVAAAAGRQPVFLLEQPRPATLLDDVDGDADWNPEAEWYELELRAWPPPSGRPARVRASRPRRRRR